jgi:hypothetical protein
MVRVGGGEQGAKLKKENQKMRQELLAIRSGSPVTDNTSLRQLTY